MKSDTMRNESTRTPPKNSKTKRVYKEEKSKIEIGIDRDLVTKLEDLLFGIKRVRSTLSSCMIDEPQQCQEI